VGIRIVWAYLFHIVTIYRWMRVEKEGEGREGREGIEGKRGREREEGLHMHSKQA
jgi:hypothetical protein